MGNYFSIKSSVNYVLVFLVLILSACSSKSNIDKATVIINASLIDFETNKFTEDQAVIIRNGTINEVVPEEEINKDEFKKVIDARGKYVIPGLVDTHVHTYSSQDLVNYVKYGVTTIFNMRGAPYHLAWRDSVEKGRWMSPHILTVGPTSDSSPLTTPWNTSIDTPDEAGRMARLFKEKGYHAIKVYNNYKPDVYKALIDSSKKVGIPVVGHIPRQVGIEKTLEQGQILIVHGEEFYHTYEDEHGSYPDSEDVPQLVQQIKNNGTWIAPNLSAITFMTQAARDMEVHLSNPEQAYLSPYAYHNWFPANNGYANRDDVQGFIQRNERMHDFVRELTNEMNKEGVPLITGTDVMVTGYPGLGLHNEIQELNDAGLSKIEALKAATVNAGEFIARYVDPSIKAGKIKAGYQADLLVLDKNPLNDLGNLKLFSGVMVSGRYYTTPEIDEKRKEIRTKNKEFHQYVQNYEEALADQDFNRVSDIVTMAHQASPDNPVLYRSSLLSDAYNAYNNEAKDAAFTMMETTLDWYSNVYAAFYYTGLAYADAGMDEKAEETFKKCLEKDPFAQMCSEELDKLSSSNQ